MANGTKTILVTGAAGLIGSHLVDYLVEQGHMVIAVDNLSIGKREYMNGTYNVIADCQNFAKMSAVMKSHRPDYVFHLAAWAHEGLSQFMPVKITNNNLMAHTTMLSAAIKYGVAHFVVGSSMSVYGDQTPPFNEDMPRKPVDIYAINKTAMEEQTEILSKVHGMDYTIIRPHNVYGPRQMLDDPYRNVVGIFINRCLAGKNFYIYGDGEQKRAFSYIDDIIPAIAKAPFEPRAAGEIINVGPTREITINQLAEEVLRHFPDNPKPEYLDDRPQEVKHAWCTMDKAQDILGFEDKVPFEKGIELMVDWAKGVGHQPPNYLPTLELTTGNIPSTWKYRKI